MRFRTASVLPGLGLLLPLIVGCGGPPVAAPPAASDARAALVTALDAWKGGKRPGQFPGTPTVHAVDTAWQGGQKLTGYEVIGDEAGPGFRTFTVKLSLGKPPKSEEVRYLVMGKEPVNVMREEDFRRNASMEDAPRPVPRRR